MTLPGTATAGPSRCSGEAGVEASSPTGESTGLGAVPGPRPVAPAPRRLCRWTRRRGAPARGRAPAAADRTAPPATLPPRRCRASGERGGRRRCDRSAGQRLPPRRSRRSASSTRRSRRGTGRHHLAYPCRPLVGPELRGLDANQVTVGPWACHLASVRSRPLDLRPSDAAGRFIWPPGSRAAAGRGSGSSRRHTGRLVRQCFATTP